MWRLYCSMLLFACVLPAELPAAMRVASLNLDKKFGPKLVADVSAEADLHKADILLLQEVVNGPKSHVAAEIAAALGLHVIFAPAYQLNPDFEEGLAVLSRYPLSAQTVLHLSHNELHFHTRVRIALAVTVDAPGGSLRVMDIHLDNRINADEKREQLDGIWEETVRFPGRFLIGGDFNTGNFHWTGHVFPVPGVQSLSAMVRSEMARRGFSTPLGEGPGTLHFMGLRLDWIYVRGLDAPESGVTPIPFSDHNSVWVKITN